MLVHMKYMLPASFMATLLLAALCMAAQPRIGVQVGVGLSMPRITPMQNPGYEWSAENKSGFVGGIFSQFPLTKNLIFRPALQFANKGFRERQAGQSYRIPVHLGYFELPLSFVYTSLPDGNGFLLGGGPTIGFSSDRDYQYIPTKSLDAGAHILLGYQTPLGFSANLTYTHGFVNVSASPDRAPDMKNRFAALTVGYLF